MQSSTKRILAVTMTMTLCLTLTQFASAQGGRGSGRGGFGFGGTTTRVRLASIEKVQTELKMTDQQKTAAQEISDKLSEEFRALRSGAGGAGGDRAELAEKTAKLNAEANEKLAAKLDDAQKKRLTEVFAQVNGAQAIMDEEISKALRMTEEQMKKLAEVNTKNREARMEAFQGFRDMSAEERTEAMAKLTKTSNDNVMAVLEKEQQELFTKMQGEKFELDRALLPRGRGARGGGQRGGN